MELLKQQSGSILILVIMMLILCHDSMAGPEPNISTRQEKYYIISLSLTFFFSGGGNGKYGTHDGEAFLSRDVREKSYNSLEKNPSFLGLGSLGKTGSWDGFDRSQGFCGIQRSV